MRPPILKSFSFKSPVLYAITLAGVDAGKSTEAAEEIPIQIPTSVFQPGSTDIPKGINSMQAAVLLPTLEKSIAK